MTMPNSAFVLLLILLTHSKPTELVKCGSSSISNARIVGGDEAKPHQYPWMAYLETQYVPISEGLEDLYSNCDGTLIDSQWVLTAAHCFVPQEGYKLNRVSVVLGAHNLSNTAESRTVIFAKSILRHTRFAVGVTTSKYDIAMVMLSRQVDFLAHDNIAPICLPSEGQSISKTDCQALGWGRTGTYEKASKVLKVVSLTMYTADECARQRLEVSDLQICAGYTQHGTCKGDAGGPLQCKNEAGSWTLQGITSYGDKTCGSTHPDVYTNVEKFIQWINEIKLS